MAAVALRSDQWNVHHLGADVPADQIAECCRDNDVDLLVITVTNPGRAADAEHVAELLRSDGLTVMTGGPGGSLEALVLGARDASAAARAASASA
jgi:methylmalonyl-CoA mutase cobalamin-binding subunit